LPPVWGALDLAPNLAAEVALHGVSDVLPDALPDGPLDEAGGKAKLGAQALLDPSHLPPIALMVVAGKVQHAMQDQNLEFSKQAMAKAGSLGPRGRERDGDFAAA
jgi:hypothetical protein